MLCNCFGYGKQVSQLIMDTCRWQYVSCIISPCVFFFTSHMSLSVSLLVTCCVGWYRSWIINDESWLVIHWWLHEPQTLWMHHLSSNILSIHSFHPSSIRDYHLSVCNRLNESPRTTPSSPHSKGLSLYSLSRIRHALKWALTPFSVLFFCLDCVVDVLWAWHKPG